MFEYAIKNVYVYYATLGPPRTMGAAGWAQDSLVQNSTFIDFGVILRAVYIRMDTRWSGIAFSLILWWFWNPCILVFTCKRMIFGDETNLVFWIWGRWSGTESRFLGPGPGGTQRQIVLGHEPWTLSHEPWGMSHEAWAMSHESFTINIRLIN